MQMSVYVKFWSPIFELNGQSKESTYKQHSKPILAEVLACIEHSLMKKLAGTELDNAWFILASMEQNQEQLWKVRCSYFSKLIK